MRRAARVDSNQKEIVAALRKAGASVAHTHTIGKGFPDIVVGHRGLNLMVEIKDGSLPPSGRKLTKDEYEFHEVWKGQVCIVESIDDALGLLK